MLERRLAVGLLVPVLAVAAAGRGPDLAVPGVSALPARVSAGELVRVSDTVRNLGTTRAARSRVEYRLVGPAGRTRVLARRAVPALAPGRASRGAARLTVPSGAPAGSYRVLVCVHGAPERNERNNCGESMPSPRIGARPADPIAATSARFTFSHRWRGVRFDCRLDGGRPVRCANRVTYRGLADGGHRFRLTASRGEQRATIVHRWTVDTTPPPAPSIDEAPAAASPESSARFAFSDAEPGVRFSCRLEDGPAAPCSNPVEYGGLADGAHRFTVAAADAAGNSGTTTHEWRIRLRPDAETGPVVTLQPTSATVSGTVTPNGRPTSFFVEYGTATSYGLRSATALAGSTPAAVSVQALLSGLVPATTYHYRVVATTCGGCAAGTSRGDDRMLTTPPAGTYQNPVFGGLPDPMGLHDLGDFYSYGTGDLFPVLHSTDLVHWTTVGTAMTTPARVGPADRGVEPVGAERPASRRRVPRHDVDRLLLHVLHGPQRVVVTGRELHRRRHLADPRRPVHGRRHPHRSSAAAPSVAATPPATATSTRRHSSTPPTARPTSTCPPATTPPAPGAERCP